MRILALTHPLNNHYFAIVQCDCFKRSKFKLPYSNLLCTCPSCKSIFAMAPLIHTFISGCFPNARFAKDSFPI